jgi:hypothetical protein
MNLWAFLRKLFRRISGVSTPFGGVSLQPATSEGEIASRVISFLGDRRALHQYYTPIPENALIGTVDDRRCIDSVREIREHLTARITELPRESPLSKSLQELRAACRDFQTICEAKEVYDRLFPPSFMGEASMKFRNALATLRFVASRCILEVASNYSIAIEGDLKYFVKQDANQTQ